MVKIGFIVSGHVSNFARFVLPFPYFRSSEDIDCPRHALIEARPKLRAARCRFSIGITICDFHVGGDVFFRGEVVPYVFLIEGVHFNLAIIEHERYTVIYLRGLLLLVLDGRTDSLSLFSVTVEEGQFRVLFLGIEQWQFIFLNELALTISLCFFSIYISFLLSE